MKFLNNKIIVVEGIDGSGKGTQSKNIVKYLKEKGINVIFQDFPTYKTPAGKLLGKYLNGELKNKFNKTTFMSSLYALDRLTWLEETNIESGDWIVFDRFTYSSLAFQASLSNEESEEVFKWVWDTEFDFMGLPEADLVLWLDVTPKVAQQNVLKKAERDYTKKGLDLHEGNIKTLEGARLGYKNMNESYPDFFKQIVCDDGEEMFSQEEIFEKIVSHIEEIQR